MRRLKKRRRNKQKKLVIVGSLSLLLFLCVGYAAFSTNLSITAKGNIKENTRVIQAWEYQATTDFHSDYYKQNIVSVTFLDNNKVPSNATESWNVSEDKENGIVMAWVVPSSSNNTKYDLYIGAKGGVIANEDSGDIFRHFPSLQSINFNNNFDTSNATNMQAMFYYCSSLTTLNLSSFDTSKVTNMRSMFDGCTSLISIDVSSFNTSMVTDMRYMFNQVSVSQLDLSNFNTSKVIDMGWMFQNCFNLTNLIFGNNFVTSNVLYMDGMFSTCESLTSLDLCNFNTLNTINMAYMFTNTFNLKKITVGANWSTSNANTNAMFNDSGVSSVTTGQC